MGPSLFQQFVHNSLILFRTIIPEPQNRHPWTLSHLPYIALSYIPFLFLAYLARRPDTYILRVLLFPIVSSLILAVSFRHCWTIPSLNVYNWGQCLFAEVTLAKAIEYAFTPEGMLKVGENGLGEDVKRLNGNASLNGEQNGHAEPQNLEHKSYFPRWFSDATELMLTLRGLRFKFGNGLHIPKHTRPLERGPFLKATLSSLIKNFLLLDFIESIIKLFPGVGDTSGGSMFYPALPHPQRFIVATFIHMLTGSAILSGFGMVYDLITFLAVAVFNDPPTSWPPVTENPWSVESLHECWAKRWHQLLRQTFLVYGGYPGQWIGGNFGGVLGTFIASGLFHESAIYALGNGFDYAPPLFFTMQAFLLVLERLWRRFTGRRVGGWYGRLWVYFVMFVLAQPMTDSWHRRGLGGGMVIPPFISPAKTLLPRIILFLNATVRVGA
ncbi:hypothetical protein E1B28_012342 [Marasmius oreades]|uniref:Wax synthase domain-containing protein n=1 Tax=Marasmius oreades TaxID=181124 RepID=A0A9P7RRF9_9AGAR|nr:uncharacterized protein E1B28_012342 [Marasmius oreades]KAG7088335.1 hypothetical protein E1B28_012342 [Marasmius oreades]